MYNWLKVKRIKKLYRARGAVLKTALKGKKPAPGDRRNFRKRIVLSNNSALAVPGLPELGPETMLKPPARRMTRQEAVAAGLIAEGGSDPTATAPTTSLAAQVAGDAPAAWADGEVRDVIQIARGMVALPGPLVDKLRLLEAFKSSQSWGLFRRPHFLVRDETVELAQSLANAARDKTALRLVIEGRAATGKSMLLLQAISHALLNDWVVIHLPEGG
jgi:small subunit ribosomal protein S29